MKRVLGIVLLVLFLCVGTVRAQEFINNSGSNAAASLIYSGEVNFCGIAIATDGTNALTVSIYDATSATGTLIIPTFFATTGASDRTKSFFVSPCIKAKTGIYANVTGSGTFGYNVYYAR